MTENTIIEVVAINELTEIIEQLVQNEKIDSDTYHSIITRLESLKAESKWKMLCVFSITTELTMDIISDPNVKKGTTKIFVNPANLHYIMSREFNKMQ
ncbi:MAG: hypothetical protein EOM47_01305 [Bacteroidia bacterium]|nr:hypothetical protein [Bacteroidia bacterium]